MTNDSTPPPSPSLARRAGEPSGDLPGRDRDNFRATVVDSADKPVGAAAAVTQSKWAVLAILFLVTGALGLPLLWVNRRFNTAERVFWSAMVLAYTAALVGVTVAIVRWAYHVILG